MSNHKQGSPIAQGQARSEPPDERDARAGEVCSCGKPAVLVFITEKFGEVPWCGTYGDGRKR